MDDKMYIWKIEVKATIDETNPNNPKYDYSFDCVVSNYENDSELKLFAPAISQIEPIMDYDYTVIRLFDKTIRTLSFYVWAKSYSNAIARGMLFMSSYGLYGDIGTLGVSGYSGCSGTVNRDSYEYKQ